MKTIVQWSRDNLILLHTLKTIVRWREDNCPVLQFLWRRLSSAHYFVKTIFQCSYFLHFYHFLMKTIGQCFIFCEDNCTSAHVDNFTSVDNFTIPRVEQLLLHTINWKDGLTQKKSCQNATIVLSILMKNRIDPSNFFNFWVWPLKIFEVKGGQYAKKLEFGQTKIILLNKLF